MAGWTATLCRKMGHPMLRARHLSFAFGIAERDAWLACMQEAMNDCVVAAGLQASLLDSLFKTADWMRNKEG